MIEELANLAPGGGLAGSVVALLVWFMKSSREDRKEYREALKQARDDFETRLKEEHARVLEIDMNAQTEIDELRRRIADAETVIQGERARARDAELSAEGMKIRLEHMTLRYKLAKGEDVPL